MIHRSFSHPLITAVLFALAWLTAPASATHFYSGTMSAERAVSPTNPAANDSVTFTFESTWRRSFGWDPVNPSVGDVITVGAIYYTFTNGVSNSVSARATVMSVNAAEDWIYTRFTTTVTGGKTLATISFSDCCRASDLKEGNRDASYELKVDVPPLQGGQPWQSARVTSLPIINQEQGSHGSFSIDIAQSAGLTIRPEITPLENSGLYTPRPVGTSQCAVAGIGPSPCQCAQEPLTGACADALRMSQSGVSSWTPQLAGRYAVQFDVARYDTFGVRKDSVPYDFIVNVVPACVAGPPTCMPPPVVSFNPTYTATANTPLSIPVTTTSTITPAQLSLATTTLPAGMTISPTSGNAPQLVSTLQWTPTFANAGNHEICFQARVESIAYSGLSAYSLNRQCMIITVPGPTVPVAPTMLAAFRGNGQAEVRFAPSTHDGGSPITSYKVISNPPGGVDTPGNSSQPVIYRTITNLVNGTPYTFTAVAVNAVGDSLPSAPSDVVIPATVPLPPVIMNIVPGDRQVTVYVAENPAAGSNGGLPVTALTVGGLDGGTDSNAGSLQSPHVVVDLENGESYRFVAVAFNQVGNSNFSTPTPAIIPRPSKPTISMGFNPSSIVIGQSSLLTITLTNPNPFSTLDGIAFTDTLPAGIRTTAGTQSACGGTVSATTGVISLSGGTLTAGSTCTITVNVIGAQASVTQWINSVNSVTTTTATLAGTSRGDGVITVRPATTAATVVSTSPATPVFGQPYVVTVSLGVVAPGTGTPTGTITISDGNNSCTAALPATSCSLPSTVIGPVTLTASYGGSNNFSASVATPVLHTIGKAATSATITSVSPASPVVGQAYAVNYSVAVNAPGSAIAGGTVTVSDGTNSCIGTLPATSCELPSIAATTVSLTATYSGEARLLGSVSSAVPLTINKATTALAISAVAPVGTVIGQPYTVSYVLTVVAPGGGTPSGTVTISDGTNSCVSTLPATSCQLLGTAVGTATITASYSGEARYLASVAASTTHEISKAATSTAILSSSPSPTVIGQGYAVNYAITVTAPGAGTPSGTVTVSDGVNSCTGTLPATNCTMPSTAVGTATLTAQYSGEARFLGSASPAVTQVINKAATSVSIVATSPVASVVGQSYGVSYLVAVSPPGTGTPTGTVTVTDGTNSCTGTLPATSCTLPSPAAGTVTLTATYNSDVQFAGSQSAVWMHAIAKAATSTAIVSQVPTTTVVGEPYVISYSVAVTAPGAGTPTGTVTVSDGSNSCTGTLPATSCTLPNSAVGNLTLTASYAGDTSFVASVSPSTTHLVTPAATVTSIVSDTPDPSAAGMPVVVVANVTVVEPGGGVPTGNVLISDGVSTCTITLPATSCVWTPSVLGLRMLTASYAGSSSFVASTTNSSSGATHTVVPADHLSSLTVSRTGTGTGAVTSNDGEINCGAACAHTYADGSFVALTAVPDIGTRFVGWLGACISTDPCVLTITAPTTVSATFALDGPALDLDIDGNSSVELLTDGLLMVRYLSGLPDDVLVAGAIGAGTPMRVTAADIRQHLVNLNPLLDVDGDGAVDMKTDGVLLLRYLSGLRGDALITNAIGSGARRMTALDIETYLASLRPAP